jgi:hypothetical protein
MALANRVAPDGSLHAISARGTFLGNRGILHDPQTRTLAGRRWTTRAWICCALDFRGRRRDVWGRQIRGERPGWTELFFLDEVTALAAGHRPCFECRRAAARAFVASVAAGLGLADLRAPQLDALLHAERRLSGKTGARLTEVGELDDLPDATVVVADGRFLALRKGSALPWSHAGYGAPVPFGSLSGKPVSLVTPGATIAALRNGYRPAWHPGA